MKKSYWGLALFLFALLALSLARLRRGPSDSNDLLTRANQSEGSSFFSSSSSTALALLRLEGVIQEDREDMEEIFKALNSIEKSKTLKGLVIRINSPGGSVGPTQEIFELIERISAQGKSVYCSLGEVAASGGYYIASACDVIYANKGSTTGSIGVIMQLMNVEKLLSWAKIEPQVMKAGKLKDMASPFKKMGVKEKAVLQELLDEVHTEFKKDIYKKRSKKLNWENLEEYADGRIFTGSQAKKLGFVDEIGGLRLCKEALIQKLNLPTETKFLSFPKKKKNWAHYLRNQQSIEGKLPFLQSIAARFLRTSARSPYDIVPRQGVLYFLPEYMF